jgi:hypothetical protein
MTNKTLNSSNSSPSPDSGVTDSPWPPSWWRWLIFALSGTVEIEKQAALAEQRHRQRMKELQKSNAELQNKNKQLAELESKIDGLFSKYGISSTPANKPEQP